MPTNDWWTSLAWLPYSERMYAHPLAFQAGRAGLRVFYPGDRITADRVGIYGTMPEGGDDVVLGHSAQSEFPDARVDGFSDWFVSARFAAAGRSMRVSFGHGSPYVYAQFEGGSARLTFAQPARIWSGAQQAVGDAGRHGSRQALRPVRTNRLDLERHRHQRPDEPVRQALFLDGALARRLRRDTPTLPAVCPRAMSSTPASRGRTSRRPAWSRRPSGSKPGPRKAASGGRSSRLYPHQWRNTDQALLRPEFRSVRGVMKLAAGESFRTAMRFPGILPCLPEVGGADRRRMAGLIEAEARAPEPTLRDTYWEGKWLGRIATLIPIAEAYGLDREAGEFTDRLRQAPRALARCSRTFGPGREGRTVRLQRPLGHRDRLPGQLWLG